MKQNKANCESISASDFDWQSDAEHGENQDVLTIKVMQDNFLADSAQPQT